jgi:DNA-binding transcriptional MerR regulator|tara:strand:- start:455 stop:784 length:330 start_codon:yes stop_codon:yes gene_type:complete
LSKKDSLDLPNKKYFTISEVSRYLNVKQTEIRYWEKFVPKLRSNKSIRIYDLKKIGILKKVKVLIKDQGIKPSYIDNYMKEKNSKKTTSLNIKKELEAIKNLLEKTSKV